LAWAFAATVGSKLTRGTPPGDPVLEPDKNVPVLIYCLKDCGDIVLKE
jgi:hypothetical protein